MPVAEKPIAKIGKSIAVDIAHAEILPYAVDGRATRDDTGPNQRT